jgi:hypothetical protein
MSMTLVIAINACLDVGLLGALAFVMVQPGRLSPHRRVTILARAERQPKGVPSHRTRAAHGARAASWTGNPRH